MKTKPQVVICNDVSAAVFETGELYTNHKNTSYLSTVQY